MDQVALKTLIRRNLILSSIAISATVLCQIIVATSGSILQLNKAILNYTEIVVPLDMLINLVCMCLMTTQWIPPIQIFQRIRLWLMTKRRTTSQMSASGNVNNIKRTFPEEIKP
jgi:hypothetical protein